MLFLLRLTLLAFSICVTSCMRTTVVMSPTYGFKLKDRETVIPYVQVDNQVNNYWTSEISAYLRTKGVGVEDYNDRLLDLMYIHLISLEQFDSLSLVRLGRVSDSDFLIVGAFNESSERVGRGFDILSPHDQIYHSEDYDRWRKFVLEVYDLSSGRRELVINARVKTSGFGYGGNSLDTYDSETRLFFVSDFQLQKKIFKKSIRTLIN